MLKWIVLALLLVPLVAFGLAVRPVLVRLPRLRRAALTLQQRQEQATSLAANAEVLQERAEALQRRLATAEERMALIRAKRGG
ncbi:hypothetical protein O7606_06885 [Micromonospora sp. WMMD882]|uniref:hypothetical protein n=1 Tax=Micromonospora sp. WMMD882 TaxID=3015151 RepID=UPI00248C633B|nr:hypothetical protein [Micromonospora sp. WMMD882]WBB81100.1 hypothetical protein O7606_06885 [Micromonospora sp. WMMD882]